MTRDASLPGMRRAPGAEWYDLTVLPPRTPRVPSVCVSLRTWLRPVAATAVLGLAALASGPHARADAVPVTRAASSGAAQVAEPRPGDASSALREQLGARVQGAGVITGATTHRILHFTFDDGPDPRDTPALLDALDRIGAKATFFFSTIRFAKKNSRNAHASDLAREVARRGHPIGSHSYEHHRMHAMKPAALQEQLAKSDEHFEKIFGARTSLFRPPHGSRNEELDAMLAERRDATVMWNIGMADWVQRPPEQIRMTFFRVLERNEAERGERGGVVLLHDTHEWSIRAFELITAELQKKNCELLARGEELYDLVPDLSWFVGEPPAEALRQRQAALRDRLQSTCVAAGAQANPVGR
jgi:peptidoglycan/xylan/chitin deacetylase (PgdA/CDA1 family)